MGTEQQHQMLRAVLPPALEVMTAYVEAGSAGPGFFHQAMGRVLADATGADDPQRGMAELLFGLCALSGVLLDETAEAGDRTPPQILQDIHGRYVAAGP